VKRQMMLLTAARLSAAALQAVALIVIARTSPVAHFGAFSIVFAVQSTVFTIGALGLQSYILREMPQGRFALVRGALRLNVISSVCAAAVALVTTVWVRQDMVGVIVAAALTGAFLLDKNSGVLQAVSIGAGRIRRPAVSVVAAPLITTIGVLALGSWADAPLIYAAARLLGAAIAWLLVLPARGLMEGAPAGEGPLATLRRVWPLAVVTTAVTFDTAIVGAVGGRIQAAYYSAASKIIAPLAIGTSSVSTVLMPHVAVMDADSARDVRRRIVWLGVALSVVSIPVGLLAPWGMGLLFGPEYSAAGSTLTALIWAVPSLTVGPLLETYLQATGRERLVAAIAVWYSLASIAGALIGTILLGALGAALSVAALNLVKVVVQICVGPPRGATGPGADRAAATVDAPPKSLLAQQESGVAS
jgi:O-antigen/teichoic acid export membrane protein